MYVIIAGAGKIGAYLAGSMLREGNSVAVIEKNPDICEELSESLDGNVLILNGDACETRILEDAGAASADIFVASTGQDETNLIACELADRIFDVARVIARVNSPKNLRIFREVGIESVSATSLIASVIREEALLGSVTITNSLSHGDVILSEFTVGHMKHFDEKEGVTLGEIDLPYGAKFVAVEYEDDAEVAEDDIRVFPGDQIIVISDRGLIPEIRSIFKSL